MVVGVTLGALGGLAGFVALRKANLSSPPIKVDPAVDQEVTGLPPQNDLQEPSSLQTAEDKVALEHRRLGLAALAAEDFEEAVREFALALKAPHPPADAAELLGLAKSLEVASARLQPEPESRKASKPDDDDEIPAPIIRRVVSRASGDEEDDDLPLGEEPPPPKPKPGIVMIATKPPGLVIRLDGRVRDLSPARIETKPGRHEITIFSGDRLLFRRQVDVISGHSARIDEDLSTLLKPRLRPPPRSFGTSGVTTTSSPTMIARSTPPRSPPPTPPAAPPVEALPRSSIREVLKKAMPRLRQCYERELAANPMLAGHVVASLAIAVDGSVNDISAQRTNLDSGIAVSCILRTLRRQQFPRPRGGPTRISIPLAFEPESS